MAINIKVNGAMHSVPAEPDTPLLYVLRNDLGLNAAKFGCGLAQCGACTVLVDGKPVRSCVTPIGTLGRSEITTLEASARSSKPHPLQAAFMAEQAAQCGYCITGMIMSAKALLDRNPHPSEARGARRASPAICAAAAPTTASSARCLRAAQTMREDLMNAISPARLRRRRSAASWSPSRFAPRLALAQQPARLPGSLADNRMLDAWIRIAADGTATVCTGKVELGQGIVTALAQIAAEELDLPLGARAA